MSTKDSTNSHKSGSNRHTCRTVLVETSFGEGLVVSDLNVGLLYLFAMETWFVKDVRRAKRRPERRSSELSVRKSRCSPQRPSGVRQSPGGGAVHTLISFRQK